MYTDLNEAVYWSSTENEKDDDMAVYYYFNNFNFKKGKLIRNDNITKDKKVACRCIQ